ncbi:hypothetical protein [Streptomyces sp. NPDC088196]|uniref:hypothetical protein n=1 Tax=Streptomyces sp. NPDC088196 TaxID=3154868 RepID=UPI00344E3BA3
MGFLFAIFGPPLITVFLVALGAVPYGLWVARKKPSRLARWAVIGGAVAIAAYGAGTDYGLAFTHPLDLCADRTGDGLYMDIGRDFTLTSVSRDSFPLSVTCHWSSGYDTEIVWFWATPLWYAGLACGLGCSGMLLVNRYERGGFTFRRTPPPPPPSHPPTSPR